MSPEPGPPRRPGLEPFIVWSIMLGIFAIILGAFLGWAYPEPRYFTEPRAMAPVATART